MEKCVWCTEIGIELCILYLWRDCWIWIYLTHYFAKPDFHDYSNFKPWMSCLNPENIFPLFKLPLHLASPNVPYRHNFWQMSFRTTNCKIFLTTKMEVAGMSLFVKRILLHVHICKWKHKMPLKIYFLFKKWTFTQSHLPSSLFLL